MTVERKVFIIHSDAAYDRMFKDRGWKVVDNMFIADLVQFTGGSDVSPELYGEEKDRRTHSSMERDKREMLLYASALKHEKPMAGICRGGQFLNVMNGGKMVQHIDGHCVLHNITYTTVEGKNVSVEVTSTHHQHMLHDPQMGEVVASSTGNKAPKGIDEIVYYDYTNCLCFQPHPEMLGHDKCTDLYFDCVEALLFNN